MFIPNTHNYMNPADLIFQAFSTLTLGIVDDVMTAIFAMVSIIALSLGYQKLMVVLGERAFQREYSQEETRIDGQIDDIAELVGGKSKRQGWHREYNEMKYKRLLQLKLDREMDFYQRGNKI